MLDDALSLAKDAMEKALDRLHRELARVRTGRANPSMLEQIRVDAYGTDMPLNQVSTISVGDARLLVIKPWDRNMIGPIEKAINAASLGLNANNDGVIIRVPIPLLTEERRKQLVKQVKESGEDAKIAIRGARRDANELLKDAEKDHDISEDQLKKGLEQVQTLTDGYIKKVDDSLAKKESEIMEG